MNGAFVFACVFSFVVLALVNWLHGDDDDRDRWG